MKKLFVPPALLLFLSVTVLQAQTQYCVSPSKGNDSNSGSEQSPFRTIAGAQEAARRTRGEAVILLHGGIYRLEKPLVFTPQDGGADKPLTVRPLGDGEVVLT
ncbi:MAG: DUF1565 domain-containing protein, partial [Tannerella sp.]|nr:DUF1565 domain-containing protein [Tannerella sp.]